MDTSVTSNRLWSRVAWSALFIGKTVEKESHYRQWWPSNGNYQTEELMDYPRQWIHTESIFESWDGSARAVSNGSFKDKFGNLAFTIVDAHVCSILGLNLVPGPRWPKCLLQRASWPLCYCSHSEPALLLGWHSGWRYRSWMQWSVGSKQGLRHLASGTLRSSIRLAQCSSNDDLLKPCYLDDAPRAWSPRRRSKYQTRLVGDKEHPNGQPRQGLLDAAFAFRSRLPYFRRGFSSLARQP